MKEWVFYFEESRREHAYDAETKRDEEAEAALEQLVDVFGQLKIRCDPTDIFAAPVSCVCESSRI